MVLPSGLMATLFTLAECPVSVLLHSPDAMSHTLAVWEGFGGKVSLNSKISSYSAKRSRLTAQSRRLSLKR